MAQHNIQSVLIVEDEAHIRLLLKRIFKELEIEDIREASNGIEGCRLYGESPTDLVIMDINLPLMNGLEALAAITDSDPEAAVIMMTSLGSRQAVQTSIEKGALDYIRKDLPVNEIKAKLTDILQEVFGSDESANGFGEEVM